VLANIATGQYLVDELLRLARELDMEAIKADIRAMSGDFLLSQGG
jgi:hypothetical protein